MLPKANRTSREHHPALSYGELPALMAELRSLPALPARALEFTVLCAVRTGEALLAGWAEIDGRVWTIPGKRTKTGKKHRVPLSDRARAILDELPRASGSDAVFPGRAAGGFLDRDAMADTLSKLRPGVTVHGMRSTFRTWAEERTTYPHHVLEMALAHAIPNGVEAAYRPGDLFEKRRRLMDEWSIYCESDPKRSAEVIPLYAQK